MTHISYPQKATLDDELAELLNRADHVCGYLITRLTSAVGENWNYTAKVLGNTGSSCTVHFNSLLQIQNVQKRGYRL
jgi:hypothetical protein